MRTALVLSSGGFLGAYQVGAWEILRRDFQPDLVVGASIGSLNGYAIAAGAPQSEFIEHWQTDYFGGSGPRLRIPRGPWRGCFDQEPFQQSIRDLCSRYQPQVDLGVVATDLLALQPRLFRSPGIEWTHLAASCAIFGVLDQFEIGGRLYTDGGLLDSLPLWAAVEMGAQRILAINALPRPGRGPVRLMVEGIRRVSGFRPRPPRIPVVEIAPAASLGSLRDAIVWNRQRVDHWMDLGRRDARAALRRLAA